MQPQMKIGLREYVAIIIIILATKVTDETPTILFQSLKNAGWMAPLIIGIISIIPILLLMKIVNKYDKKGLLDVIYHVFGKYLGFIVVFILWLILTTSTLLSSAIYTDIIGTMYYIKTPTIIIYAVLLFVCAYGAKRGFEQVGSIAWIVLPYLQAVLFISLLLLFGQGNLSNLFPIFGPGGWEVVKESTMRLSIYSDFLFLFILYPYVTKKGFNKGSWIGLAIITIQFTIAMVSYVMLFDYQTVSMLNFPFHEAIRSIQAGFLTNVESFILPFWLMATFIRFSVYLYVTALVFGYLFQIRNFEYVIPAIATIILFIGMIPDSPTFLIETYNTLRLTIVSSIFFFLPFVLWVTAKLKGDLKQ